MRIVAPDHKMNLMVMTRKRNGNFNLTGLELALLADAVRDSGKQVTWEITGGMIVWDLTQHEMNMAIAYLGQLRRTIEVIQYVGD